MIAEIEVETLIFKDMFVTISTSSKRIEMINTIYCMAFNLFIM